MSRFPITSATHSEPKLSQKQKNRIQAEGKYERLWKTHPEHFNPDRNIKEMTRIERTLALIDMPPCKGVDLGLGWGRVADRLIEKGFEIDGVDISQLALDHYKGKARKILDFIPYTKLEDHHYQLVMALDLIAELPEPDRRLLISEMTRLVTADGKIVITTAIDIDSVDAVARFLNLVETEIVIERIIASYHAFWIRLYKYRLFRPLIRQNGLILKTLESLARFLKQDDAISHLMVIGRRKPIYVPPVDPPIERKAKRTVWE